MCRLLYHSVSLLLQRNKICLGVWEVVAELVSVREGMELVSYEWEVQVGLGNSHCVPV